MREFDCLFDEFGLGFGFLTEPALARKRQHTVVETDEAYKIEVDVPGVRKKDIDIDLLGQELTVQAKRKGHATYRQTFGIPDGTQATAVTAECANGVLTVTIVKPESAKSTRVHVR